MLLEAGAWQEADRETARLMLLLANKQSEDWLREKDIARLSCSHLLTINKHWVEASQCRFGLSVQRDIWISVTNQPNKLGNESFRRFGDLIGWRVNGKWLNSYNDFTFSLDAPVGHLPSLSLSENLSWFDKWQISSKGFLMRIQHCITCQS